MTTLTGGCQCGAIRFSVPLAGVKSASICHCRMCQKAFGSFYAPLANARADQLVWTRGARSLYRSSNRVQRGFCNACGTPLTYEFDGDESIAVSIGAFDTPAAVAPTIQYGVECKQVFVDELPSLPGISTADSMSELLADNPLVSYQHPDHDTAAWPPETDRP